MDRNNNKKKWEYVERKEEGWSNLKKENDKDNN